MYVDTPHALEGGVSRRYGTPCTDIDSMQMVSMALFGSRARVQKGDCVYSIVIV